MNSDQVKMEEFPEPMNSDQVKMEEFPSRLESGVPHSDSQDALDDAQFQTVTDSGKLYVMEFRT